LKNLFTPGNRVAGIDVGSHSVQLVELAGDAGSYELARYARVPLNRGIIDKGVMKDPAGVTDAVKKLFARSKCRQKNVAVALPGHVSMITKATFPAMDENELRDRIIDDAREFFPIDDISNVDFDFFVLGENAINPDMIDVVIGAARKEIIASYRNVIEKAGCKVTIMDIDAFALETAYEENYDFDANNVVVLIHSGASITNITIIRGGASVFTRNISQGGDIVTETIQKKLSVSFDNAEMIKKHVAEGSELTVDDLVGFAEPIIQEIKRSIDYFNTDLGGALVSSVVLSGGNALLAGFRDALSAQLRVDVQLFDPFQRIAVGKKVLSGDARRETAARIPVGMGLALRKTDDK